MNMKEVGEKKKRNRKKRKERKREGRRKRTEGIKQSPILAHSD